MTIALLKQHGVECDSDKNSLYCNNTIPQLQSTAYHCEPDYSTAPYYWLLSILTPKKYFITLPNESSMQGDIKFIDILIRMGAKSILHVKNNAKTISFKKDQLRGVEVSMNEMPDQVISVALLALFCSNKTCIRDIDHLKYKESNRIENLIIEFNKLNATVTYCDNILTIYPCDNINIKAHLSSHNDHRFAIIFLILKQIYRSIIIDDVSCIKKSAPEFLEFINQSQDDSSIKT